VTRRSFPILYVSDLRASRAFYTRLGFEEVYRFPPGDDAGFVSLRYGETALGLVTRDWPEDQLSLTMGSSPRGELWVYVEDVDAAAAELRAAGTAVLKEPADMPWGERIAYVSDPDGNPVALAHRA
jgi:lactoylglutathione lyase